MRLPKPPFAPTLISAGYGGLPVLGSTTSAPKSIALPSASTCTVILVSVTVPVTASGFGFSP
ncbi:MAG: hypothetical protein DIU78_004020 [Pseudomonadota bacterium]